LSTCADCERLRVECDRRIDDVMIIDTDKCRDIAGFTRPYYQLIRHRFTLSPGIGRLQAVGVEGIASIGVSRLYTDSEPALTLCR
jgi:hypothetical protein